MNKEILDTFKKELARSSPHAISGRSFYAIKFLEFAPENLGEWNNSVVSSFIIALQNEGYAPGTCRYVYGVVKRVFDAAKAVHEADRTRQISEVDPNDQTAVAQLIKAMSMPGPNWDLGKRSVPRVEAEDVVKPAATLEHITTMVVAAKDGVLTPAESVYLGLSSVYGLRREELCRVRPEHLDLKNRTIYVMTCKGGERRNQRLCEELIPFVEKYGFAEQLSLYQMSAMYTRIATKAGLTLPDGSGWHSNRRFLDTELRDLCGELETKIFLRWRISSSSEMVERYYSRDKLIIDEGVIRVHPVLPLWR